ncbi:MAG TPA: nitronate monooxygenase [Rhodanobacter sp.]|nr:nitronate monooxygenase [Rhodanobacter sp.]
MSRVDLRNLAIPILQAPIGSVATVDLAAAVSNAGGMGSLALTWTLPDTAARLVQCLHSRTRAPFFVNFVLAFAPVAFDAVIDAGAPVITLSWGHAPHLIQRAHRQGVTVGVQVGTAEDAARAIGDGADFVICQGAEAGGHVQSAFELATLLPEVVRHAGSVPVVATGGLADGAGIRWAIGQGATAAMLGTRFVATAESAAHPSYKNAIVRAKGANTTLTYCFDGGWPGAAHRVIRNRTLERWEAAGSPPHGLRPGEGDIVATDPARGEIWRYDDMPAMQSMTGEVMDCCLFAGLGVDRILDTPSARELVEHLWNECRQEAYSKS